jgi:DNA topoisomerase IB
MNETYIRAGNTAYEKEYGSFGLTTLKNRHVNINGAKAFFTFKGEERCYASDSNERCFPGKIVEKRKRATRPGSCSNIMMSKERYANLIQEISIII